MYSVGGVAQGWPLTIKFFLSLQTVLIGVALVKIKTGDFDSLIRYSTKRTRATFAKCRENTNKIAPTNMVRPIYFYNVE